MSSSKSEAPLIQISSTSGPSVAGGEAHPLISAEPADTPNGLPVRVHVDARGVALAILASLAVLFTLQWAQEFLIPVVFSIFISYTLTPVVGTLERLHLPRIVAASLVMITLFCGIFLIGSTVRDQFNSIIADLPSTTSRISKALAKVRSGQPTTIQQMQAAANEIAKATNQATTGGRAQTPGRNPTPAAETPAIKITELLWVGSMGAIGFVGQTTMVLFLVFFLLLSGDKFKRKLVKLTGPSLSNKKITVQILDEMNHSVQRYMFMLLVTNVLLGLMMWGALYWIGLANAGAWAVAAALMHIIPYFGPLLIMVATGIVAFMQFETLSSALLVAGVSLAIATVVGTFVTTWMTGRIAKMNAAAVFISLLFWGWLWGIWGLLLGIPIVVIVKVIAEHVEGMQTVAELLGE